MPISPRPGWCLSVISNMRERWSAVNLKVLKSAYYRGSTWWWWKGHRKYIFYADELWLWWRRWNEKRFIIFRFFFNFFSFPSLGKMRQSEGKKVLIHPMRRSLFKRHMSHCRRDTTSSNYLANQKALIDSFHQSEISIIILLNLLFR